MSDNSITYTTNKIYNHVREVQSVMQLVIDELYGRMINHDASKFGEDELEGYARFGSSLEGLEYESVEWREAKAKALENNNCHKLHFSRNDHHPEHFEDVQKMRFPQLFELVCDWAGAHLSYGSTGGWHAGVEKNIARYNFLPEQKWLIRDLSLFLSSRIKRLQDLPSVGVEGTDGPSGE